MREKKLMVIIISLIMFVVFSSGVMAESFEKNLIMPQDIMVEEDGTIIVADTYQHRIVKLKDDVFSVIAGKKGKSGYLDGKIEDALFNKPKKIVQNKQGVIYVADSGNHVIRKIVDGKVYTFAGNGKAGYKDGSLKEAQFKSPMGMTLDNLGNLYIADTGNHVIRKIDVNGNVTTFAGNAYGFGLDQNGKIGQSFFNEPVDIAFSNNGIMLVVDSSNHKIKKIQNGLVSDVKFSTNLNYPKDVLWIDSNRFLVANTWNNNIILKYLSGKEEIVKESNAVAVDLKENKLYEVLPWEHKVLISDFEFKNDANQSMIAETTTEIPKTNMETEKEASDEIKKENKVNTDNKNINEALKRDIEKNNDIVDKTEKKMFSVKIDGKLLDGKYYYSESDTKVWLKLDYIVQSLGDLAKWDHVAKQIEYKKGIAVLKLNFDRNNYKLDANNEEWVDLHYTIEGLEYNLLRWTINEIEVTR